MLAILAGGEVRVTLPGGEKVTANAEDGFLSVHSDAVQVVASRAELA
jgi:F-type H+-transporting ATPase subunit epsilon